MRTVARYSLNALVPEPRDVLGDYLSLLDQAEAWLGAKGQRIEERNPEEVLRYLDGREGTVRRSEIDLGAGGLRELVLSEPIDGGAAFETRLLVGLSERTIAVLCDLHVGGRDQPVGPIRFDAGCPRVVRDLLSYDLPWTYGAFPLSKGAVRFRGNEGGDAFASLLTEPTRTLPVVAVTGYEGLLLHPGIADDLSRDLAALAVVALLDGHAAWRLTQVLGAESSCYNGAIRLYWPRFDPALDRQGHPVWTARRLLDNVADTAGAAKRIRNVLRRQILAASAFAIREPAVFDKIRSAERSRRFEMERGDLKSSDDYVRLAESYAREAEELRVLLASRQEEVEALKAQVENLQISLRWQDADHEESLSPDTSVPPATVEDAVARARVEHADALSFGADVDEGVRGLSPDAGPPDKVLSQLQILAALTAARNRGSLGASAVKWLNEHGAICSGESETVRNSPREQGLRTWGDGHGGRKCYDLHLKPNEATSPDRCVRIYFDYDEGTRKHVVGWVGRKPGL